MTPEDMRKLTDFVEALTAVCNEHGYTLGVYDGDLRIVDPEGHVPSTVSQISWEGDGFEFYTY